MMHDDPTMRRDNDPTTVEFNGRVYRGAAAQMIIVGIIICILMIGAFLGLAAGYSIWAPKKPSAPAFERDRNST